MNVIAVTQKGLNKTENEDRVIVGKSILANGTLCTEFTEGILAVADGVGGCNAGSIASHFVANRLCSTNDITIEQMQMINNELLKESEINIDKKGMATTLSGVYLSNSKSQLFSIGNTRVYLLQSGKYLKQLTSDDTTLNYLLATGQLSIEDAEKFDRKNEITACFGGGSPDLFKIKLNDIEPLVAPIIITSDGIHDHLSVDKMENIIEEFGLCEKACIELIDASRRNGSCDDASIILGVSNQNFDN